MKTGSPNRLQNHNITYLPKLYRNISCCIVPLMNSKHCQNKTLPGICIIGLELIEISLKCILIFHFYTQNNGMLKYFSCIAQNINMLSVDCVVQNQHNKPVMPCCLQHSGNNNKKKNHNEIKMRILLARVSSRVASGVFSNKGGRLLNSVCITYKMENEMIPGISFYISNIRTL